MQSQDKAHNTSEGMRVVADRRAATDGRVFHARCPARPLRHPSFPHLLEDVIMTHRLIRFLAILILAAPLAAEAQPARKVFRIGFLFPGSSAFATVRLEPFRQRLRELGYVEGQHYVLESRVAEGQPDRLPDLAADLVRLPVDVIVVAATGAAKAAKNATNTTPIVMVDPGDPVSAGLVASLAQPGGNTTGLSSVTPDLVAKNLHVAQGSCARAAQCGVSVECGDLDRGTCVPRDAEGHTTVGHTAPLRGSAQSSRL